MRNLMVTLATAVMMLVILAAAKACLPTQAAAETVQLCPSSPTPLVDPNATLRQHAERSIALSNPKLSPARKTVFTSLMIDTATRVFQDPQQQRYWIALIGVESGYDGRARSSKGAVGLGQLMPAYKRDFGASCGLTDVTDEDIRDDATNLMLSACYFRSLIETSQGDLSLALVSYNAGPYSKDVERAKRGQQPSKEPRDYRAKVTARAEGR